MLIFWFLMNSQNRLIFKIAKSSLNKHLPIHWSCFDTFFMHKINLTHPKKEEKRMKRFFPFFENFDRDFGTLGTEIVKIWLQIRTFHRRIKLYGNFGCVISLKNNQLACLFFCHPVSKTNFPNMDSWNMKMFSKKSNGKVRKILGLTMSSIFLPKVFCTNFHNNIQSTVAFHKWMDNH